MYGTEVGKLNKRWKYLQSVASVLILIALGVGCGYVIKEMNPSILLSYFTLGYFLFTVLIAYSYRSYESDAKPSCDVIVPAYNEGRHVYDTIKSIVASDYDPAKFTITVVDDGSTDDTRVWIRKAVDEMPQVRAIYLPRNSGKKHALSAAIRSSNAEVLITVDSDSTIEKDAISNIVKPFVNEKIGAVAGNIRVQNINEGAIPQMLDIIFVFCYEFLRSSQSRYGTVLCTPGALSAYRRQAVLPLLDEWLNQRFLGEYTSIGEDRALSRMLLCQDWEVVFQGSATSYTNIPASYSKVCKMLLRWVRGDIRENILMFPYVVRNFTVFDMRRLCLELHYISFSLGTIAPLFLIPSAVVFLIFRFSEMSFILGFMTMATMIWSIIPAMIYAKRCSLKRSLYAFVYGVFSMICLSWIPIYAVFTIKNNKWMTRR